MAPALTRAARRLGPELRALAAEQPDRLDRGQLDDPEDDLGGDRHAVLVVVPGPDRNPECPGQVGASSFAIKFSTEAPQPIREPLLDLDRFGCILAAGHGSLR